MATLSPNRPPRLVVRSLTLLVGLALCRLALADPSVVAEDQLFRVRSVPIADEKAVFATVESLKVTPARARISGTVAEVRIAEGDLVTAGQVVGMVGDEKLALQILSLESGLAALESQRAQADKDLKRLENLSASGAVSRASLDAARTAFVVADNSLKAARSERDVIRRQLHEGTVEAPVAGRVLDVLLRTGTVVMSGEVLATIAEEHYVLRLEIPERHARIMKVGDPVRIDQRELENGSGDEGRIVRLYPRISEGRVMADAEVEHLGNYFVGQRIRVWLPAGSRQAILVPEDYLATRGGMDFVRLAGEGDEVLDVAVQRGRITAGGVEILSGLRDGDQLRRPQP